MDNEKNWGEFNKLLNSIPIEEFQAKNEQDLDQNRKDFEALKKGLAEGRCSYCHKPISHFSLIKPCFHWLLKPKGFRTRYCHLLFDKKSFHQIEAYLRWVANCEVPLKNINDLVEEKSPSKIIEETIRFKNLEWSFSCTENCLRGDTHNDRKAKPMPHYHFQMKADGRVIIKYGLHMPFSDYDEFCFAVKNKKFDRLIGGHIEGVGMQALFEHFSPGELLDQMRRAEHAENAQFNMSTLITADEGKTISGDDLANLMEEHNRTGVPMAKLIQKLNNVKSQTFISPGPGVPEIAARKKNR